MGGGEISQGIRSASNQRETNCSLTFARNVCGQSQGAQRRQTKKCYPHIGGGELARLGERVDGRHEETAWLETVDPDIIQTGMTNPLVEILSRPFTRFSKEMADERNIIEDTLTLTDKPVDKGGREIIVAATDRRV